MAPRSKRGKLLTCFYCGRRSTTRFDGKIQSFDCSKCDATNYLDAAGDITDPPVATTATPDAPTYARRSPSPNRHPAQEIFCRQCTSNQHLVVSSLAQYLPDDPDDPEYAERERNYYKFRRGLEKRYPQCCSDCEPKVRVQLGKANYTAKTDWLRRQLDYSSQTRVLLTRTGANYVASVGKWMWIMSWFLQLLWHLMLIQGAAISSDELDPKSWAMLAARVAGLLTTYLPTAAHVAYWSFMLSFLGFWWNPKWVESWRGFTRHLHGFKHFYTYQAIILILKFPGYLNVSIMNSARAQRLTAQVFAHGSMIVLVYFLYRSAGRSIQTDNRKLWLPRAGTYVGTPPSHTQPSNGNANGNASVEHAGHGGPTMADVLDEILNEPTGRQTPDPQPYTTNAASIDAFDQMPTIGTRRLYNPFNESAKEPALDFQPSRSYTAKVSPVDEFDHMPPTSRQLSGSSSNPFHASTPGHQPAHLGSSRRPSGFYRLKGPPVDESYKSYLHLSSFVNQFDNMPQVGTQSSQKVLAPSAETNPFNSLPTTPVTRPGTSGSNLGFSSLSISDQRQTRAQTRAQTRILESVPRAPAQQQPYHQTQSQLHPFQHRNRQPQISYDEEMEWTPERSALPRAFATYKPGPPEKRGFNETPVIDNPDKVFWAKIPPKPTTPAQRLFNRPGQPIIRTSVTTAAPTPPSFSFKGSNTDPGTRMMFRKLEPTDTRPQMTEFAERSFLPQQLGDERDSLADAFKRSFSLTDEAQDSAGTTGQGRGSGGQTLGSKFKYSIFGLCLAVVGHWVYQHFLM